MKYNTMFAWMLVIVILVAFAPSASAQSGAGCYVADVPGPIMLPDNSVEQKGRLEICLSRMYSPVAGFHKTSVNGRVAGMFISRKVSEANTQGDSRPYFVFAVLADGTYELESYVWVDGQKQVRFEMRSESIRSRWQVQQAKGDRTRVVFLAALGTGRR